MTAVQPYSPPRQLAPDLWVVDGEWYDSPLKRRMTIVRARGGLLIHGAIRLRDDDWGSVDALGPVRWIVVPNHFHGSEAHAYKARYPQARLLCSPAAAHEVRRQAEVDHVLPGGWDLAPEVEVLEVQGTRWLGEWVLFHRASRTLVTTDLVFNVKQRGLLSWVNGMQGFGPTRLFRWVFTKDRRAVGATLGRILAWDFDRVVMSHGEVLETGGREALRAGFARRGIYPSPSSSSSPAA